MSTDPELEDAVRRARETLAAEKREIEELRAATRIEALSAQLAREEAEALELESAVADAEAKVSSLKEREAKALAVLAEK